MGLKDISDWFYNSGWAIFSIMNIAGFLYSQIAKPRKTTLKIMLVFIAIQVVIGTIAISNRY